MNQGLLHELLLHTAFEAPTNTALIYGASTVSYHDLARSCRNFANGIVELGLQRQDRVGVYLPKQPETVATMFGACAAGAVFVPVNPLLKPEQVRHIINDSGMRALVTSAERAEALREQFGECPALKVVITTGSAGQNLSLPRGVAVAAWSDVLTSTGRETRPVVIDCDMAALLYTSGSTGRPKGVVLSHRNMVTGARSVASYLGNTPDDRLLAVLPFSFDYGFSQLSTAFSVGASVSLLDYLLPRDVLNAVARDRITGLAGVPPLWAQLAQQRWPHEAAESLRYITNSGGKMPRATLERLRESLPRTQPFLMYGLTEAFRSTYLPPEEVNKRPDSIGQAIPNAEIMVVREDGTLCEVNEPGELVHRGSLVAMGYWNDPQKTEERFKPAPNRDSALVLEEIAVWSGDLVYRDADGFLFFVGRRDDMIKTSGYRVSPTEVEEAVYASGLVKECAAIGLANDRLGQEIVIAAVTDRPEEETASAIILECRKHLANFMVPSRIVWRDQLPRNPNGKIDRKTLAATITRELTEPSDD